MIKLFCSIVIVFFCFQTEAFGQSLIKEKQFSEHKFLPFYGFKKKNNTHIFQGNRKKHNYFEGWYFKMVSEDGKSIMSVIPGISLAEKGGEQHAFIQLINGVTAETSYYSFPIEDFYFSKKDFAVRIGQNYFSDDSLVLKLDDGKLKVNGQVKIAAKTPYKIGNRKPAIMGWYRFVPFMQCYHGVVSLTHQLSGNLTVGDESHNFNAGRGYIEKDWGESMPEAWIWMQTNHFTDNQASFMLSVATIPWLGKSFTGFLGFLYHNGKVHRFATYSNANLAVEMAENNVLNITIKNKKETILITTKSSQSGILKAPVNGAMDRRIAESIDASMSIKLLDENDQIIYNDSSNITGLEMVGDIKNLILNIK